MASSLVRTTVSLSFRSSRDLGSEAMHNAELGGTEEVRKLRPWAIFRIPATMMIEQVDVGIIGAPGP